MFRKILVCTGLSPASDAMTNAPVMLSVCSFCNRTRKWFPQAA